MPAREFPKVYSRFEGKNLIDGKRRQYWIQDATEDLFSEILDNLTNGFIGDEPTTKYLKCQQDPTSMAEFKEFWAKLLLEKLTIVCLTKDSENNTKLAGFNMLTESKADKVDADIQIKGESIRKLFNIIEYCEKQRDFHKEFNLKTCMKAMGLYVLPGYRGDGLGEKILDARELLCRHVGINATITAFTSIISQKVAAKVGYQDYFVVEYEQLGQIDPVMKIPDIEKHSKCMKFMYKLYN